VATHRRPMLPVLLGTFGYTRTISSDIDRRP
jgi:hypothetical protein